MSMPKPDIKKDPRVVALVVALGVLQERGMANCTTPTTAEAEGFLDGTCTFESFAASRGVETWVIASAWCYVHQQLTGFLSLPADESKNTPRTLQ